MKSYQASFQLLVSDLQRILEFVEPTDANGATYSHRIYELFLRVCTEFESLCKDLLVSAGAPKAPSKMNLGDYRGLETSLKLEPVKALVLYWRPQPWETQPPYRVS